MVLVTLKTLSLCLLLPIPFGAIVTSLPTPPESLPPSSSKKNAPPPKLEESDRKAGPARLIPTLPVKPEHGFEAVNSEPTVLELIDQHQSLELTHLQPVFAQFQWDVLIGAEETSIVMGDNVPSFVGKKAEESDPEANKNWPFMGLRGPRSDTSSQRRTSVTELQEAMGQIDLVKTGFTTQAGKPSPKIAREKLFEKLEAINFHSGPNHHTREGIRILKEYGARFASGLEAGIDKACEEEEKIWHGKEYPALVAKLYGEAGPAVDSEKLRWKLHRLFQNNCVAYDREEPEDLHHLLEFGQKFCIQPNGIYADWTAEGDEPS
ncbi:hypothetical protein EV360DRAFT_83763 [Lentinula raphanica]|nr:hypothetical protein EV360DRAFT_83763 [Lentinula raphanica]